MPKYLIVAKTTYEVCADDELQAQLAVAGVAAGCNDDQATLGERRRIMGCLVQPEGTEFESTVERKDSAQLSAEGKTA